MTSSLRDQFECIVVSNAPLCREHYRLVLGLQAFPPTEPGQFIQIACRNLETGCDGGERVVDWSPGRSICPEGADLRLQQAFLRRPFSLAGRRDTDGGVELDVIHRVVGVGTDWLSRLTPGDRVGVLGPLGNRFELPPAGAPALLVGGGVGIPPMIYLAEKLAGRSAVVFSGAVTRELLPLTIVEAASVSEVDPAAGYEDRVEPRPIIAEFARYGIPSVISTDDGSFGFRGFVTQALEVYLDQLLHGGRGLPIADCRLPNEVATSPGADRIEHRGTAFPTTPPLDNSTTPPLPTLYTCGPEPMMKRVAAIAAARGIECQVAVERAMACGMGTCQSCCIRVRKPDPSKPPLVGHDWCYRLACTDGPVFRGADLLW